MALVVQHKRSSTPGYIPTASELAEGEIFINLADKIIYVKDATGTVVVLRKLK